MAISLRQLEIFEKVAQCEHVTQASTQLFLTQSAVSMAIAELERVAGAPLFERRGKRLLLNDRGRKILPEAEEVVRRTRAIEQFLEDSAGEPRGVLNVGASTTIGNYILPELIAEFSGNYPDAKVLLTIGNAHQIEHALEKGELDLGLIEGIPHSGVLDSTPWKKDELVVVVGKGHPWACDGAASVEMLGNAPWIMRETGSGTREVFEGAMAGKGISFSISLELGHTEAIKKAIEAGLGVGCLSRIAVNRELEHGWLVEIACPLDLKRTLSLQTRQSGYKTRLLCAFWSLLNRHKDI
ncbi:LysR family transcriptional regulator [Geobacter sulfurreducens]|uniref:Helix-turn-helix transcriptional regulator, LysR family n=1 Tax=Geobacter sulfurreducens (strain ATCC 51573 / DSM 12127 / PCA) TaxID=243231 RepID=Q749C6_GEOSL|nr:LysR family transcriptional regulator [Geobacter sulfurreducens]AAR36211.1 helix-turn-helix transcriptional regulator, LysR family [Geobacter sulfurreducens PCA]AJY69083.1 LysR family transcriptional regulator [Geobacter sulfurreducens]UAC03499.1 LysR family transcriptional regulator [Geobacter sulfurreducens]HBB68651.1 LysR family transcriptional regulator [Geobacter sulfurreducens]HCD97545.1 LysR family transcriptional regulator [Geobacter sulfurreducens]